MLPPCAPPLTTPPAPADVPFLYLFALWVLACWPARVYPEELYTRPAALLYPALALVSVGWWQMVEVLLHMCAEFGWMEVKGQGHCLGDGTLHKDPPGRARVCVCGVPE